MVRVSTRGALEEGWVVRISTRGTHKTALIYNCRRSDSVSPGDFRLGPGDLRLGPGVLRLGPGVQGIHPAGHPSGVHRTLICFVGSTKKAAKAAVARRVLDAITTNQIELPVNMEVGRGRRGDCVQSTRALVANL